MNTPPQHQSQGLTMPQMNNPNQPPRIKPEPGLEDNNMPQQHPTYQSPVVNLSNATTAQQRAAQHLQNTYGQRASASINAIQQTNAANQQGAPQQGQPNPSMAQMQAMQQQQQQQHYMQQQQRAAQGMPQQQQQGQRPTMTAEQYRMEMARRTATQQAQIKNQNGGVNGAQTDGAGEDEEEVDGFGIIKRLDSAGNEIPMGRIEIDGLIRRRIEAMGQSMEGGGLMLPLQQASTKSKRSRKVVRKHAFSDIGIGGGDMADDDELDIKDNTILDEDAINSDLDDPDDGLGDDEDDDETMGNIMLCMYDKVQRVKNKWYVVPLLHCSMFVYCCIVSIHKIQRIRFVQVHGQSDIRMVANRMNRKSVMKDGVLTVNGREYVFHKATGEYEW